MAFTGVSVNKLNGGLGRKNPTNDDVCLLIVGCNVSSISANHNTLYKLIEASSADTLGFTAAYDTLNQNLVRHHIEEFFRLAPNATLYVVPVLPDDQDLMFKSVALLVRGTDAKMIGIAGGKYKVGETEELVQEVVDSLASEYHRLDAVLLEGAGNQFVDITGLLKPVTDFFDLRTLNAPNVSVCIAQSSEIPIPLSGFAEIGAALGMLAVRLVSENLGSVSIENYPSEKKGNENYPLNDALHFRSVKLSNGQNINELSMSQLTELDRKGYIFAASYSGYAGVFFNGSPTCIKSSSDYAYIENNRIWNKAARGIRNALLPRVKSRIKIDASTGYITDTQIGSLEATAGAALQTMLKNNEISGYDVYIDKTQVVDESNPLVVKAKIVKDAIVFEFSVDLGYSLAV